MDLTEPCRKRALQHTKIPKQSPWKRGRNEKEYYSGQCVDAKMNAIDEQFDKYKYVNMDLDLATKRAALKASASVVALSSQRREGGETIFNASGTIYETCEHNVGGRYLSSILTSASLFGSVVGEDVEIKVYVAGGRMFDGNIVGYDVHYNLAIISILCDVLLPVATLRLLDDSVSIKTLVQSNRDTCQLRPHSRGFKICAGEMVVALGRSCNDSDIMVAPGKFSVDDCGYDCMELMMATCIITKPGIGGPLLNCHGEVIGVNFMNEKFTPFLAMNIVDKWLNHFKRNNKFCRPWIGVPAATNLYATKPKILEHFVINNPEVSKGVFVDAVVKGSPAHCAGLKPHDVIIQCNGRPVKGFLELCRKMLNKGGKAVEIGVIRKGCDGLLKFNIDVEEFTADKFNCWPLPEEYTICIERFR